MPLPNVILHISSIVMWKPGNGCWKSTVISPDFTRVWFCALFSHVCICVTTCRISWDSELFVTPRSPLLPPKAPPTLPGDCLSAPCSVILSLWESVHRLCQSVTLWDWLLHSAWCLWDPSTRLQVSIYHSLLLCGPRVTNPSAAGWPLDHLSFWPLHGKPLWRSGAGSKGTSVLFLWDKCPGSFGFYNKLPTCLTEWWCLSCSHPVCGMVCPQSWLELFQWWSR